MLKKHTTAKDRETWGQKDANVVLGAGNGENNQLQLGIGTFHMFDILTNPPFENGGL